MRILKVLINIALLRGKNRIPRFFFLVALCGFVLTIARLGVCNFAPAMCGSGGDLAKYGKARSAFEDTVVSIQQGGVKGQLSWCEWD